MSQRQPAPDAFAHLTDLSAEESGTFVPYATDDYFADRENLVKPDAPEWREGAYTARGKWMDGWESQRRRAPGHDFVIVRLGIPGAIEGVLCDTTHFKGNAPAEVALEILEMPAPTPVEELLARPRAGSPDEQEAHGGAAWLEVLPRTAIKPDHANLLRFSPATRRATHVRLRIHPDGGVARLRVYGVARPEPRTFWGPAAVDLAAAAHGGRVVAASDQFFGPASNLLLPGRGRDMGDGWETRRRRAPGTDWCVIQLGRRGRVERLELDTYRFKGNAPQAARIESLDAPPGAPLAERLDDAGGWDVLVEDAPLAPHHLHVLEPARPRAATHLRLHLLPHGGVNRLRVLGHALDTPAERAALAALAALSGAARRTLLLSFCGAAAFADGLEGRAPFASVRALFADAGEALDALDGAAWLEAFAAHPRLGSAAPVPAATERSARWSRGEQSGVTGSGPEVLERLRAGNEAYERRFGFTFICCATGLTAAQVLERLERRLVNDREAEIVCAAREQARITRLRIEKWLRSQGAA